MKPLVLIDSSAWLFALGSKPVASVRERVSELVSENLAAISSPILFELLSGIKEPFAAQKLKTYLTSLHPFPLYPDEWLEAAKWAQSVRKKGLKVKTMDALIAFKAIKHGLVLLHADQDMDRIAQKSSLRVESLVDEVRSQT